MPPLPDETDYSNQYENLIRMLREQDARPGYTIHEPVVVIGDHQKLYIGEGARIDSYVKLEIGEGLIIGTGVHIASFAHVGIGGGRTALGDYAAVASGAKIISGSNLPSALSMSASAPAALQRTARSCTQVGRYAAVLTNAVVLPGVVLHEGAVLAAGGVATKDIPAWEIHGGVPARKIGERRPE